MISYVKIEFKIDVFETYYVSTVGFTVRYILKSMTDWHARARAHTHIYANEQSSYLKQCINFNMDMANHLSDFTAFIHSKNFKPNT
jgi:hypothetical protein